MPTKKGGRSARAGNGHAAALLSPIMKSRRRIAFLKAWDHANRIDNYSRDLRQAKWGSEVSVHGSNPQLRMSAQSKKRDVRFTPESGHGSAQLGGSMV